MSNEFESLMDAVNMPQDLRALARAIHKQESRSGTMDTSRPNYAGAIGPMQVTEPTFEGLKKAGWIPSDFNFRDRRHATIAGLANIVDLANQFDGDVKKVAAAYYAGPKAIRADGSIKPLRDRKNPRAPNAQEYAEEVVGTVSTDESGFSQFIAGKVAKPNKQRGQANLNALMDELQQREAKTDTPPEPADNVPPAEAGIPASAAPSMSTPAEVDSDGYPTNRSFLQKAGRIGAEVLGGVGGGIGGTAIGGPVGGVAGLTLGSALGSKIASETFDPLPDDVANREAVLSGAFSLAGLGAGKVAGKVLRARGLVKGGSELIDILAKRGTVPVPSQAFQGNGLKILENIGEASLVGSGSLKMAREAAVTGVRESAEAYKQRWLGALVQGERMLQNVATGAAQRNVQIPMQEVRIAADTMKKVFAADSAGRKAAEQVLAYPGGSVPFAVPFKDAIARNAAAQAQQAATGIASNPQLVGAQQIRANLLDIIRTSTNNNEIHAARETVKVLDNAISKALAKADPGLHAQWRMGNAFYRAGKQGEEISTIMSKALVSGGETGEIGGKQLLNQIKEHRVANLGSDLSPQQLERLAQFGNALKAAEGSGDHAFQFVTRGLQVSAVVQIAAGATGVLGNDLPQGVREGAFVVALGPVALAKLFASPTTFKLLLTAMRAKAGTAAGAAAGTQFVLQAMKEGVITSPTVQQGIEAQQMPPE